MKYLSSILKNHPEVKCIPLWDGLLDKPGYVPANISLTNYNGHIIYAVRLVSYICYNFTQWSSINQMMHLQWPCTSIIVIGSIDGYYKQVELNIPMGDHLLWNIFKGPEDPRLYVWQDRVYMNIAHSGLVQGKVVQLVCKFNQEFTEIEQTWQVNSPNQYEKNWAPIQGKEHTFLYDPYLGNTITLCTDAENPDKFCNIQGQTTFLNREGGSSQVIPYKDDQYLTITHNRGSWINCCGYRVTDYTHNLRIMQFEGDKLKTIKAYPFKFLAPGIEFCCGLTEDTEDYYIGFSVMDSSVHVMKIPKDLFEQVLQELETQECPPCESYWNNSFISYFEGDSDFHMGMLSYINHIPWFNARKIIKGLRGKVNDDLLDKLEMNINVSRGPKQ